MLTMLNSENYTTDPVENSIKIIRGGRSFDSGDYILFYASGPKGYSSENNTNLNLFEDKTSYFLNIGSENGLRIDNFIEPQGESVFQLISIQTINFMKMTNTILQKSKEMVWR